MRWYDTYLTRTKLYILVTSLIFFLVFSTLSVYSQTLLKGGIRTVVEKGREIEISLSTPINFYYSQSGDKVAGYILEDIYIGEDLYISKGSRVEGIITNIKKPKKFGQNGAFEIDFTEIVTPDNISVPIYASVSTDTSTVEEKVADILSYDAALITYGGFHGALAGLQYGGLPLAIASHGISVLAGAGVGAGAGIIGSIQRKGKIPTAITGTPIKIALKSNLFVFGDLPVIKKEAKEITEEYKGFRFYPAIKEDEIELVINNVNKNHSDIYGNYITIEFTLKNNSNKTFSFSDLVLIDKTGFEKIHPDLFLSKTKVLGSIKPNEEINSSLAFLISRKESYYSLSIIDPLDRTTIVKIPLNNK